MLEGCLNPDWKVQQFTVQHSMGLDTPVGWNAFKEEKETVSISTADVNDYVAVGEFELDGEQKDIDIAIERLQRLLQERRRLDTEIAQAQAQAGLQVVRGYFLKVPGVHPTISRVTDVRTSL